jgi:hypothetical protein
LAVAGSISPDSACRSLCQEQVTFRQGAGGAAALGFNREQSVLQFNPIGKRSGMNIRHVFAGAFLPTGRQKFRDGLKYFPSRRACASESKN